MKENEDQWKADTDLEMANHCMELSALRNELDDLKRKHHYAVAASLILCDQLEKIVLEMEKK
jgi:hypothetical protein